MRLGNKIGLIIITAMPIWIFVRAQLIYKAGPLLVKQLEEYKIQYKIYPEKLEQLKIDTIVSPTYLYQKEEDQYNLMYSIFVFNRWCYNSENKKWYTLD